MTAGEALRTEEGARELEMRAAVWVKEAEKLENDAPTPTLPQKIGDVLLMQSIKISDLVDRWGRESAGTIVKGEPDRRACSSNIMMLGTLSSIGQSVDYHRCHV